MLFYKIKEDEKWLSDMLSRVHGEVFLGVKRRVILCRSLRSVCSCLYLFVTLVKLFNKRPGALQRESFPLRGEALLLILLEPDRRREQEWKRAREWAERDCFFLSRAFEVMDYAVNKDIYGGCLTVKPIVYLQHFTSDMRSF